MMIKATFKIFTFTILAMIPYNHAIASVVPTHVVCNISGKITEKYTEKYIDRFMGGETKRTLHNIKVKIKSSQIIDDDGEGECGSPQQIVTFTFREWTDRFKYKEGDCISASSQISGSSTYNANWIYDIEKLAVEKCGD